MAEEQKSWQELMDEYQASKNPPVPQMSMSDDQNSSQPQSLISDDAAAQNYPAGEPLPEISAEDADAMDKNPLPTQASEEPGAMAGDEQPEEKPSEQETPEEKLVVKSAKKQAKSIKKEDMSPIEAKSSQSPIDYIQALKDAQKQQQENLNNARIDRGGAQMLGAAGRTKPDYTQAEAEEKQAGLPVQNLQQNLAMQQLQTQLSDAQEMRNPQSETSKMLRDFANKFGFNLSENISGAHVAQVAPWMVKAFEAEENRKARIGVAEENRQARLDIAGMKGSGEQKSQDSAYQKALTQLNTSRLPPDIKQAKIDQYLASKANLIFNKYPDLNKITEAQKNQLLAELGKIAQGGVPTAAELKGIDPNTFEQGVQHFISRITNVPQGAQVGPFLQQQKEYLGDLSQNAQERISGYHNDIINEYEPIMGKTHADKLRELHAPKPQAGQMIKIKTSDGQMHNLPAENLEKAKKRDPGLQVVQ